MDIVTESKKVIYNLLSEITENGPGKTIFNVTERARGSIRTYRRMVVDQAFPDVMPTAEINELDAAMVLAAGLVIGKAPFPINDFTDHFILDHESQSVVGFDITPLQEWLQAIEQPSLKSIAGTALIVTLLGHLSSLNRIYLITYPVV